MRYISVIFLLFSFIAASQNNCNYAENEVVDLFNKINKTDKSNLNNPEIRRNDFYNNFDTVIYLMNCSDFEIKNGNYTKREDRKSTRLNSSHVRISYAVFCLKKKTTNVS